MPLVRIRDQYMLKPKEVMILAYQNVLFAEELQGIDEETLDYIKCMTLTKNVNPEVYNHITRTNIQEINDYIDAPMTATTFSKDESGKRNREIITAELLYYWMIDAKIPFECQKWHLNRLITLIRVCSIKNTPPKKRSSRETANRYAAMNAARRKQLNSKG